jgi:prepilin peptidase CpaA
VIPVAVVLTAALVATVTDLWCYKLYNVFTLPLLVSGIVYHSLTPSPPALGLGGSLLGFAFGFGVLLVFHLLGGVGGGDLKFMAAVGAWLGLPLTFDVFLASSLAAGLYALVIIVARGRLRETWLNLQLAWLRFKILGQHLAAEDRVEIVVQDPDRRWRVVPFGGMVALGLLGLLIWLSWQTAR